VPPDASASTSGAQAQRAREEAGRLPDWWPLAALLLLAALIRLPTLGLQSLWFDEAFTPVHVLHAGIVATLKTVSHTENTPPLWYVVVWAWTKAFGTGALALRLPSALAGIALVAVVWGIACELCGRRVAVAAAALTAVNPLFVWYSQEARAYELYTLTAALAVLCFVRSEKVPSARRMAAFALAGCLALLTHYFAVFLLVPMSLWLLRRRERRRLALPAVGAIALVGAALVPLVLSQGGNGTQWIGKEALSGRVQAIAQYYLTGYSGAPLGRGIELAVALPLLAGLTYGLRRGLGHDERRTALAMLALSACGVLAPIAFALAGADYLAARNVIAAMVPVTVLLAALVVPARAGRAGAVIAAVAALALLAICVDVDLSPRLQRGDWKAVAAALERPARPTVSSRAPAGGGAASGGTAVAGGTIARPIAVVSTHLGSAPIEYYAPSLRAADGSTLTASEIDEVGYSPLLPTAESPPAPGFRLVSKRDFHGELLYRFLAPRTQTVPLSRLAGSGIAAGETDVLASRSARRGA
jgi:mannosyltransferase